MEFVSEEARDRMRRGNADARMFSPEPQIETERQRDLASRAAGSAATHLAVELPTAEV